MSEDKDKNGDEFEKIAQFLKASNRAPAPGEEPNWSKLVGAKGRAHIKVEKAEQGKLIGKLVNRVAYYVFATDIKPARVLTNDEARQVKQGVPISGPGGNNEPDDIPFSSF
jgi:hypothetical protein